MFNSTFLAPSALVSNQLISLTSRESKRIIPTTDTTVDVVSNQLISLASRELKKNLPLTSFLRGIYSSGFQSINFPSE